MKQSIQILMLVLLFAIGGMAGTPVMDGIFDGENVWGPPKAVADGLPGWADANAKKIYVTDDANYIYFGAMVTAAKWMSWAFIVNTKPGGGSYDSWSRSIDYAHTDLPDYAPRGHFCGTGDVDNNYAEFNFWNGTAWDGYVGLAQTEFADTISVNHVVDAWIEIRIPKSDMGNPDIGDVQFYITGDQNSHGNFDACPDDENATAWDMSANHNILKNYQTGISLNTYVSAIDENTLKPSQFQLLGNFPNPFNPSTTIRFTSLEPGKFNLQIFNVKGEKVIDQNRQFSSAGLHEWLVDFSNTKNQSSSGVYLYTLTDLNRNEKLSGKLVLIK